MGMRKYRRQIARARITAVRAGNVNKKMGALGPGGEPLWRRVIFGDLAKDAEAYQVRGGGKREKKFKRRVSRITA